MQEQPNTFAQHVAAAWHAGVSIAVYAKTHGLAASTLYRWQQKLRNNQAAATNAAAPTPSPAKTEAVEPVGPTKPTKPEPAQGKFIALRIQGAQPQRTPPTTVKAQKHLYTTPTPTPTAPSTAPALPNTVPTAPTAPTTRASPIDTPAPPNCTLLLAGGIRLELPTLPEPNWLAALSQHTQAAH